MPDGFETKIVLAARVLGVEGEPPSALLVNTVRLSQSAAITLVKFRRSSSRVAFS
jgi:hypothetical protein